jgi:Leucine-rich repeat (LRR) protein
MKILRNILVVAALMILVFTTNEGKKVFAEDKLIEDPVLESAIRDVLQKYSGGITKADIGKLKTIYVTRKGNKVKSLKGLEFATNLLSLYLADNQISDVSPLANLPKLTKIDLGTNQIKEIRSLRALPSLVDLSINHNQLSDISVLKNSPKLGSLSINHNQISDISSLAGLNRIYFLNINENLIEDISAVTNMKDLHIFMASNNSINNINPLKGLGLQTIEMNSNRISDISGISNMTELLSLKMANNQISDLSPLANLTNLSHIWMGFNQIKNLEPLKNLPGRMGLYLNDNEIFDITPLITTNVDSIYLINNKISNVDPIVNMKSLRFAWLSNNQITNITALQDVSTLSEIDLTLNPLDDSFQQSREKLNAHGTVVKFGNFHYSDCSIECINLWIDGKEKQLEQAPQVVDGRILISLRELFETLGAKVDWNPKNSQINATKGNRTVVLKIGSKNAKINGALKTLDVEPQLFNEKTYVPVRFVSEALGAEVKWDALSSSVYISTN